MCISIKYFVGIFVCFSLVLDSRQMLFSACDSTPWVRPSQLDYLSLDFNSASPSPVQKVSGGHEVEKKISEIHFSQASKAF